ncbi:MAG: hypothetical protein IRZ00_06180 [Gemmatimonadetes bacterium]|nr:hypothetical protein [Gemmatimonadota bacterium]
MRARTAAIAVAFAVASGSALWALTRPAPAFPHAKHASLFPLCIGCHEGIPSGDRTAFYPDSGVCVRCHDGAARKAVAWSRPAREPSNLRFSHPDHDARAAAKGDTLTCASCHAQPGPAAKMAVGRATPDACVACHMPRTRQHLALESTCTTCHVPIARAAGVPVDTIAAFPKPETHAAADFVLRHRTTPGEALARCAICHARESCARCHLNADKVPAIAALASDRRLGQLALGRAGEYPLPPSHADREWPLRHGAAARKRIEACANCHAQAGCRSCHIGEGAARAIAALPVARPGGPSGVVLGGGAAHADGARRDGAARMAAAGVATSQARRVARVHPAGFAVRHGTAAATDQPACSGCHQTDFCVKCHDGPTKPGFHPTNYVSRHATDSYAARSECSSCHNTQAFCQTCHKGAGLAAQGRAGTGGSFHNGQPLWLLQHGQAARQGLEQCASCHAQSTCLRCHSQAGWGVDPHGPGFSAERMGDRNQVTCKRCHVGGPPGPASSAPPR